MQRERGAGARAAEQRQRRCSGGAAATAEEARRAHLLDERKQEVEQLGHAGVERPAREHDERDRAVLGVRRPVCQ
jgi:hypothetical protein